MFKLHIVKCQRFREKRCQTKWKQNKCDILFRIFYSDVICFIQMLFFYSDVIFLKRLSKQVHLLLEWNEHGGSHISTFDLSQLGGASSFDVQMKL